MRGRYGKLIVFNRKDNEPTRIGIVVSSKLGGATVRNRAKRKVREVFRAEMSSKSIGCDITYILWTVEWTFSDIQGDIHELLMKSAPDPRSPRP